MARVHEGPRLGAHARLMCAAIKKVMAHVRCRVYPLPHATNQPTHPPTEPTTHPPPSPPTQSYNTPDKVACYYDECAREPCTNCTSAILQQHADTCYIACKVPTRLMQGSCKVHARFGQDDNNIIHPPMIFEGFQYKCNGFSMW